MPSEKDDIQVKFFPRNLTAKAAVRVTGNPVSTRPESGVGNTAPGLEFDERGLDKYFFPGLTIEFQWSPGSQRPFNAPLVREVDVQASRDELLAAGVNGVYEEVVNEKRDLKDLVLLFKVRRTDGTRSYDFFHNEEDLGPWRSIRDMEPGKVKILLATVETALDEQAFEAANNAFENQSIPRHVEPSDPGGGFKWAVLSGKSRELLDQDTGVIDSAIPVGELQSTMCTPWQYDFRDCRCYYWASNRPDLVSAGGLEESLRFFRKDRSKASNLKNPETWEQRDTNPEEPSYVQTFNEWEHYPVVLNDREFSHLATDVGQELQRLAQIEHGLVVEYLYAYYSLNQSDLNARAAAREILSIAIDEMRHFRWVNEILHVLGKDPVIGRVENYGRNFEDRHFELEPLSLEKLNWFISVERPSRSLEVPGQIDGMYVRLHQTISENRQDFAEADRILELIKLIIDEGEDHYQRFMRIEDHLAAYLPGNRHLYVSEPPPDSPTDLWLEVGNVCYHAMLVLLLMTFRRDDAEDGRLLGQAVACMHAMDDFNKDVATKGHLIVRGSGLRPFELPAMAKGALKDDHTNLDELERKLREVRHDRDWPSDRTADHVALAEACLNSVEAAVIGARVFL